MHDIKWIRENPEAFVEGLASRGGGKDAAEAELEKLIRLDEARRTHLTTLQEKQERRNAASREIGNAVRKGDTDTSERLKAEVAEIKSFIQNGEAEERRLDEDLRAALAVIPNLPLPDVPVGKDEHDNVEVRRWGGELIEARQPNMPNKPKEHWELGEALGLMDFERAAKLSGARFTVLKDALARLERALGQFMLDLHTTEHGYTEVQPPLLVRNEAMFGTGQLPKFEADLFPTSRQTDMMSFSELRSAIIEGALKRLPDMIAAHRSDTGQEITAADFAGRLLRTATASMPDAENAYEQARREAARLWLIPTAEVPLTNLVREEITESETLPLRFTALTPCFRSEAGSAGRDTRGMLRQHQFDKVELVSITDQETSLAEHERMTACAEEVLKRLSLPYRTVVLCTGDMGFGARKTYDIEVWLPGQNAFREISSCSVCGDFQARRMDARTKGRGEKQTRFVHTLNGSGVAVGRALIAVMENYQDKDGGITIPEALRPYMSGLSRIEARG
ncbi:MAG TPA: serine--tRNA ligase [Mesorhizobium sp.]|jgi:seryl-tRNA synthetase|nr:serine--tRNA ligase [Mesorhizobium sp.]